MHRTKTAPARAAKEPTVPLPRIEDGHVRSEFEHLLRGKGCPTCRHVAEAERSFFSWFEIESHTTLETQTRLRAGMGMCPAHSRRLIKQIGAGHVMTTVAREALTGARQLLQGDVPQGLCPACEAVAFASERARHVILAGLVDPATAVMYGAHGGMCLPHMREAAATAEPAALTILVERLLTSLREEDDLALELLVGADEDTPRRARCRDQLPSERTTGSTIERLSARLAFDACPVCLCRGLIERDYTQWFVERSRESDPSIRSDPGELCSAHLHDVAHRDRAVIRDAIEHKRAARIGALQRLLDHLAALPPAARRRHRAELDDLDRARARFNAGHYCSACHARDGIEHSQLELLSASLTLEPVRERYEHSHGLCARHAAVLAGDRAAQVAKRHADARLRVLTWEVQETARKYAWAYRHEADGPERDASLRALAQIDGRAFEGAPAPEHPDAIAGNEP